jgi:hypothetical protein
MIKIKILQFVILRTFIDTLKTIIKWFIILWHTQENHSNNQILWNFYKIDEILWETGWRNDIGIPSVGIRLNSTESYRDSDRPLLILSPEFP